MRPANRGARIFPLLELNSQNAPEYLRARGIHALAVTELSGGVSSTVLRVDIDGGSFVLKQSLARLKVAQEWLSRRDRIRIEAAALRALAPRLPTGSVPEVLWEDASNYLYAMTAAPMGAVPWKTLLLEGNVDPGLASAAGDLLGHMIASSWANSELAAAFGDQQVFDELRLDPYYRTTASRHPALRPFFDALVEDCRRRRLSLVHGDWSPKNLLVSGGRLLAIDFEVMHFGNPAFDAGFLVNHLLLKSFLLPHLSAAFNDAIRSFWSALVRRLPPSDEFEASTVRHLGGLMLARVDGKSPAEYIATDQLRSQVRDFAVSIVQNPPVTVDQLCRRRFT